MNYRPVDQDPEYKLSVSENEFRCSGCNLPTHCRGGYWVDLESVGLNRTNWSDDGRVRVCEKCAKFKDQGLVERLIEAEVLLMKVLKARIVNPPGGGGSYVTLKDEIRAYFSTIERKT